MTAAATHAISWRVQTTAAATVDWGTPPALYLALDREFGFTIDIAADPSMAKRVRFLTKETDALGVSWAGERVFCNPPYGRQIDPWTQKGSSKPANPGRSWCSSCPRALATHDSTTSRFRTPRSGSFPGG